MSRIIARVAARVRGWFSERRSSARSTPFAWRSTDAHANGNAGPHIKIPKGSPGLPVFRPFLNPCATVMPLQTFYAEVFLARLGARQVPLRLQHLLKQVMVTPAIHIFLEELGFAHDPLLVDPIAQGRFRVVVDRLCEVDEFLRSHGLPYLDQSPLGSAIGEDDWPLYSELLTYYKCLCRMRRDAELLVTLPQGYSRFIEKHLPAMFRDWELRRPKSDDTSELAAQWTRFEEQRLSLKNRCTLTMREIEALLPRLGPKAARTYVHLQHTYRAVYDQVLMSMRPDKETLESLTDIAVALEEHLHDADTSGTPDSYNFDTAIPRTVEESLACLGLNINRTELDALPSKERHKRVQSAYRRLQMRWHNDKGGDHFRSVAINVAAEILLGKRAENLA